MATRPMLRPSSSRRWPTRFTGLISRIRSMVTRYGSFTASSISSLCTWPTLRSQTATKRLCGPVVAITARVSLRLASKAPVDSMCPAGQRKKKVACTGHPEQACAHVNLFRRFPVLRYSRQDLFDVEGEALPALINRHAADERVECERCEFPSFVGPRHAFVGGEYLVDAFIP